MALKHSFLGVCTHACSLCFPANRAGVPSEKLWSAGAVDKPSAGTHERLAEGDGEGGGRDPCRVKNADV